MFYNYFGFRGALFLPHWIPDLSLPDNVLNFASPIPILGWTGLHLLPFIYVGSQILYTKVTATPDQKSGGTMKLMMYGMPIIFFFILYEMPSGLEVYWIMSNLLTMVQQLIINRSLARKKAEMAAKNAAAEKARGTVKKAVLPPKAKAKAKNKK
jgi:YidC/Oxa1 family membrane protein insertase